LVGLLVQIDLVEKFETFQHTLKEPVLGKLFCVA